LISAYKCINMIVTYMLLITIEIDQTSNMILLRSIYTYHIIQFNILTCLLYIVCIIVLFNLHEYPFDVLSHRICPNRQLNMIY